MRKDERSALVIVPYEDQFRSGTLLIFCHCFWVRDLVFCRVVNVEVLINGMFKRLESA